MDDEREVRIGGRVTILQGDTILANRIPNHIVNNGLKGFLSAMICQYCGCQGGSGSGWTAGYYYGPRHPNYVAMYCGQNINTVTTFALSDLVTKINTAPASMVSTAVTNPSTGRWKIVFTAVWNAGAITNQIGEIGLYNGNFTNLTYGWTQMLDRTTGGNTISMTSRVSAADGDFVQFVPDPSRSLTINWEIGVNM
jgi:hypothetical protein